MRWLFALVCTVILVTDSIRAQDPPPPPDGMMPQWIEDSYAPDNPEMSDYAIDPPSPNTIPRPDGGFASRVGFGGPGMGEPGYRATWYPSRPITNSAIPSDLGLVRQNVSAAFPIWKKDGDTVLLSASVRNTLFFTDAIMPDSQQLFPQQLWNINTGLMHIHKFDNGWTSGLRSTFGSASDKPFNNINVMNVSFFGFLQTPAKNDRDAWLFSLFYSPVGNVEFPIPGIAYLWKPNENLTASIGLPFSVKWKPVEELTLTVSYIPVTNINARATYLLRPGLEIYTGYEWLNEAYFLANRAVLLDRFLGFEMNLISGLRWEIGSNTVLDVNGGYAFNRYYGIGQNQFADLQDQTDISPGAFLGASLLLKF